MTSTGHAECDRWRELLPAYGDGELAAPERAALAAHLADCAACRDSAQREAEFGRWLRSRFGAAVAPPDALRERIVNAWTGARAPSRPAWARVLASEWTPRIAMAAMLAFLVALPLVWWPHRTPAFAVTAASQHACHGIAPGAPLPPCCTALAVAVGGTLGPPSAGRIVPDLAAAGLQWKATTRCTFAPAVVNLMAYESPAGGRFSLYISDRSAREFRLLRTANRAGVTQARYEVDAASPPGRYTVTVWQRAGFVFTWVGPSGDAAYDAALSLLQSS